MRPKIRIPLWISCLWLLWISGFASVNPNREFLGIAPQDVSYYKLSVIKCKDGSKKFTKDRLNDEFCDCPDGTDEPGTSACPEGKFYCQNAGHIPLTIFSSRVNDGICDCCDGSDEYDGKVKCTNTCWEAGKATREKLKKKIETHQEGLTIRKQEIDKAKHAFDKDESELSRLKSEEKILQDLVEKLKEHKERIEKAEEEERLKKKEEKLLRDAEINATEHEKPSGASTDDDIEGVRDMRSSQSSQIADEHDESEPSIHVPDDDSGEVSSATGQHLVEDQDDSVVKQNSVDESEIKTEVTSQNPAENQELKSMNMEASDLLEMKQDSEATEGLSKEELGRLVASRWTGEHSEQKTNEADNAEEGHEDSEHIPDSVGEENYDGYYSETDDDEHEFDNDAFEDDTDEEYREHVESVGSYDHPEDHKTEFSDLTLSGRPSWLDKIQQTVQNVLQTFNFFKTPVDISEGSRVRKEYDDAKSKLSKLQSRISSLSKKLKYDFGKEKEFYSFYGRCFENKQNKYVYKVCPFKSASQVEGHSSTQLGQWDKFDESYRVMLFMNGDRCWNGPDRSLKVRLRCGLKEELADVDEPSRCEYAAILSTPVLCLEEKLKELQQKLEDLNRSQIASHDEL